MEPRGNCFFHVKVAFVDMVKWMGQPRKPNGSAVDRPVEIAREKLAHDAADAVVTAVAKAEGCRTSDQLDELRRIVASRGRQTLPVDLVEAIANSMNCRIRVPLRRS